MKDQKDIYWFSLSKLLDFVAILLSPFFSSNLSSINPYTTGAGRYPSRFEKKMVKEFAEPAKYLGIEVIMIPVNGAIKAPPKKRASHPKIVNHIRLSKNGIGIMKLTDKQQHIKQNMLECFVSYPPILFIIAPPTNTPIVGLVKHITAKEIS